MLKFYSSVLLSGLMLLPGQASNVQKAKLSDSEIALIKEQLKKEIIKDLKSEGYSISKAIGEKETLNEAQGSYRVNEAETAAEEKEDWDKIKNSSQFSAVTKKGFMPIPGTDSFIRFYGFANMKCIYTRHQNASGYTSDLSVFPEHVAYDSEGRKKKHDYNFLSSDSRFGIETYSTGKFNGEEFPLKTLFEFDFSGGDDNSSTIYNKYKFKIRHIYMTIGNFLAGMTTSTFIDPAAAPEINGPGVAGSSTKRVPQLRYVFHKNNVEIRCALERVLTSYSYTKSTTTNGKADVVIKTKDAYAPKDTSSSDNKYHSSDIVPAAVLAIKLKNDNYHLGMAGVLRYLRVSNNTYHDSGDVDSVLKPSKCEKGFGYGARFSGSYKFANKDSIFGSFSFGTGIGLFLADAEKSSIYMTGSGDDLNMELLPSYGAVLGYRHFWSEKYNMRSTLAFGFTHLTPSKQMLKDLSTSISHPEVNKNLFTANLNFMMDITKNFTCGVEFCHAVRHLADGRHGSSQIIMLSTSISF